MCSIKEGETNMDYFWLEAEVELPQFERILN
jgi:hypothetical protein